MKDGPSGEDVDHTLTKIRVKGIREGKLGSLDPSISQGDKDRLTTRDKDD